MGRPQVLEGAVILVHVTHPVTDTEVLGALGKRVVDKAAAVVVLGDRGPLRTARWIKGEPDGPSGRD